MSRKKRLYFETEETQTTIKKRKGWIEIDMDYTQFYECLGKVIASLNSLMSIKLLCWGFTEINKQNMFTFNETKLNEFNKWLVDNGGEPYNKRSVYNSLKELVDIKVFIKWSNSSYQINPMFIWSDAVEKRLEHLKDMKKFEEFMVEEEKVLPGLSFYTRVE